MFELLVFWSLTLFVGTALAVLRDVLDDDPRGHAAYSPPRSHPYDEFARRGSDWH